MCPPADCRRARPRRRRSAYERRASPSIGEACVAARIEAETAPRLPLTAVPVYGSPSRSRPSGEIIRGLHAEEPAVGGRLDGIGAAERLGDENDRALLEGDRGPGGDLDRLDASAELNTFHG